MNDWNGKSVLFLVVNEVKYDQRVQKMALSFSKWGADVMIYGRTTKETKDLSLTYANVKLYNIQPTSGPLMYWRMNQTFITYGREKRWDLVISNDIDTLWAGYKIVRFTKAKWGFDAHEYFTEVPELLGKPIRKWIWSSLGRILIPKTDVRYTVGPALANVLSEKYRVSFSVIKNVPLRQEAHRSSSSSGQPKVLLYQGALNKGRGIEELLLAMQHLPDYRLWIAGEGDLSSTLREMSDKLGLANCVRFLGQIDPSELRKITSQAWLGFNLLHASSLNYYYSLANKFYDYAMAGVPSVNMDFPEYRRLHTLYKHCCLLNELSAKAIITCVRSLEDNPARYKSMRDNCALFAADHQWEGEELRLESCYMNIFSS